MSVPRLALFLLLLSGSAWAGAPDWMKQAAAQPLPTYPADTNAVVLFHEARLAVKDSGEMKQHVRVVYKILRTQGRGLGRQVVCYDNETRVTYLKGWSITATGIEQDSKQKDAVETQLSAVSLYSDDRCLVLEVPGADSGAVVGFEYEQRWRPFLLESHWYFQGAYPVRTSRFVLELPNGWESKAYWMNHEPVPAANAGDNQQSFELHDLPAIEEEAEMPPRLALGASVGIQFYPRSNGGQRSWNDIGAWAAGLINERRQPTPAIQQKVAQLTAGAKTPVDKMRALAGFAQHDIRYVAIEIGIGGLQPHLANDVLANQWGDCKDKAALLSTMLAVAGIQSDLVLVNDERDLISPDHPFDNFNHVILAIHLPAASVDGLYATADVTGVGPVLFFDPTNEWVPFGLLPGYEQSNYGLVVTQKSGVLVKMPVVPPEQNRLQRTLRLSLLPLGELTGQVHEVYSGAEAADRRAQLRSLAPADQKKYLEAFLARFLPGPRLLDFTISDLDHFDKPLVITYNFDSPNYAKSVGNLLLVRPRVLGDKRSNLFEAGRNRERSYPVEFENLSLQTDDVEITLPPGYVADEVPDPVKLDAGSVSYTSKVEVKDNVVHYDREYRVNDVYIGTDHLQDLKKFYRQLAGEEQNAVVFKRQ